jgi:hypothetical protein
MAPRRSLRWPEPNRSSLAARGNVGVGRAIASGKCGGRDDFTRIHLHYLFDLGTGADVDPEPARESSLGQRFRVRR